MKKAVSALLLFIILLLSGCSASSDINERVIIQGIGIDLSDSGGLAVTVQALNKNTYSGIGGTKVPENLVDNYFLEGKTVADALSSLPEKAGDLPLYTHTRIILIGEKLARKGVKEIIDYFSRDSSCRANLHIAVCEKSAREILISSEDKESIPAVEIENAVKSTEFGSNTVDVHIYEFLKMYREKTTACFLPVIKLIKGDNNASYEIEVSSTAVFDEDKLTQFLNKNESFCLLLFNNKLKKGTYSVEMNNGTKASFNFCKAKTKVDVGKSESYPVFDVNLKCTFDNVEFISSNGDELNEKMYNDLRTALESQLSDEMSAFLNKMSKEYSLDCMRLGRVLLIKQPDKYKEFENNWNEILKKTKINVKSSVNIRRIGQENGKSAL